MIGVEVNNDSPHVTKNWYTGEKPGWHEWIMERTTPSSMEWVGIYLSTVDWINCNVDGAIKHARWRLDAETATFRFRYERDYLRFLLRWS